MNSSMCFTLIGRDNIYSGNPFPFIGKGIMVYKFNLVYMASIKWVVELLFNACLLSSTRRTAGSLTVIWQEKGDIKMGGINDFYLEISIEGGIKMGMTKGAVRWENDLASELIHLEDERKAIKGYVAAMPQLFGYGPTARINLRVLPRPPGYAFVGFKKFLQMLLDPEGQKDGPRALNKDQIKALLMDIVVAVTDATSTMVEWVIAEILNNPSFKRTV
ncbi:cytochrome P450 76C1-like protein [Tanacetum coccineum]